jgi:putative ABC transport system permease protein
VLVTAEIALALPLLVAAGMTALGTTRFLNGPQGYDPDGLLTFRATLPEAGYPGSAERARFVERAVEAFAAMPGVMSAAATNVIPASSSGWTVRYEIEGEPVATPNDRPRADYRTVTPAFFETMRMPITRGRGFTALDNAGSQPVAIVSDSFAQKHWPNQDPIGRRVVFSGDNPETLTIVGTVGNHIHDWFLGPNVPALYRPSGQRMTASLGFVIRTAGDPVSLTPAARRALAGIDPEQPIYQVSTQRQLLKERTVGPQYAAAMMALFGVLALLLSVVGIYALVGYYVEQRRQEIGVRMALGAGRGDIVRQTVWQAATMAMFGVVIGTAAAYGIGRMLESALFGIAQADVRLLAGFAAALSASALIAGYVPARRAAGIDPMLAMRND